MYIVHSRCNVKYSDITHTSWNIVLKIIIVQIKYEEYVVGNQVQIAEKSQIFSVSIRNIRINLTTVPATSVAQKMLFSQYYNKKAQTSTEADLDNNRKMNLWKNCIVIRSVLYQYVSQIVEKMSQEKVRQILLDPDPHPDAELRVTFKI